ncbi:MAG: hypothetical protein ACQEUN_11655 [Pseudomonadota bacterium]
MESTLVSFDLHTWLRMTPFADLQRRFRELTTAELEDPEHLATLSDHGLGTDMGWPELLQHSRAILLAEAGAGKTREMDEQARQLRNEGKFAFFVPLESLDRESLANLLSADEEAEFESWKADSHAPAWFFLDAVDELKLTSGKLDRALQRLSKAIGNHIGRARTVISCRPSDWRPSRDLDPIKKRLGSSQAVEDTPSTPDDESFLQALRQEYSSAAPLYSNEQKSEVSGTVHTVVMLPLSDQQIRAYAQQSGVHDPDDFLAELNRKNAWTFARRPLDLAELIATWIDTGRLGTRAEQHEINISAKLRDDPERPDCDVLPDSRARAGAERLALALFLTRTRTLRSPEQSLDLHRAKGVLNPATILEDWTDMERQALLRRALFDPATYGRVRFHHRSVQEYLAARRLKTLRDNGMSIKALFRLIFAKRYGVEVMFPSVRPIAAWLALWDDDVRLELARREPEVLLSLGDPESLPISARCQLLKAFMEAYGKGSWRGFDIPIDEVRRLAAPELAPLVRELWGNGPTNPDVRELLIELIWLGPIEDCADLVEEAARDSNEANYHRTVAIRALIACGKQDIVYRLAEDILVHPDYWTDKIVISVAADLFPRYLDVDKLITLMERTREPEGAVNGFGWVSRQIVEDIEPQSSQGSSMRDQLADLIWRGRNPTQEFFCIRGQYDHLSPALAMLCERLLTAGPAQADPPLIRACVVSSRFGDNDVRARDPVSELRNHFRSNTELRRIAFWEELALMDQLTPAKDDWQRYYQAEHGSLIGQLAESDRPWLEAAVTDQSHPERRSVALHALIQFWHQRDRVEHDPEELRDMVRGEPSLRSILEERTAPRPRDNALEMIDSKSRQRREEQAEREAQRIRAWETWRAELLGNPDEAFSPSKLSVTIANLHAWLRASSMGRNRFNIWDKEAIARAFGPDIAGRAEGAFQALWRKTSPLLWSKRSPKARNTFPSDWIYGLCGVSAEAETPGWATALSTEEARVAAAYATVEMNGFAPFINDLVMNHPEAVDAVVGGELSTELLLAEEHSHLPVLQDLTYAESKLKRLLAPRLLHALTQWPSTFTDEIGPRWAHHLDQVLRVLRGADATEREIVAKECASRYKADTAGLLALVWLRGLFHFDPMSGVKVLTTGLAKADAPEARERAIETFAGLFGERESTLLEIEDRDLRARALVQLVRTAYTFVRREDDQEHESVFTPDTRDLAETARNFLLSALLDTPGPEARRAILELAEEPDFSHFPDRLRLFARQRAAADAEFSPYDVKAVSDLDTHLEAPPYDRDGLFQVVLDRLDDLKHDIACHPFTNRRTLRSITDEEEMQRTLALQLEAKANGTYVVTREDEVADRKRTDFRLSAVRGDQQAVVELKLADKRWSLSDLERALRDQLVGQYLRHSKCKAGCLLLTYDGTKKYWQHPDTHQRMSFSELVDYLIEKARVIEAGMHQDVRLAVVGLDLTDPPLTPAHR